tara:strand:+ start:133153 stop:140220 length:7068 start_codon:yes stop_codon:yes gene_type:complete
MIKNILTFLFISVTYTIFGQAFISTWNTSNQGTSSTNEITIPTNPAFTNYNYSVDWGDGTSDTNVTGNITHTYATPNIYTVSITDTFPAIYFNNTGDRRKITGILSWGTIQWQTMENAFYGCENLNFDLINSPDLSQVTSLKNMFRGCDSFNGILNNWSVSTITDISGMFHGARIFNRPLDGWITNSVTDMSQTFKDAYLFNEPLDNWVTNSVLNMSEMFYYARDFNQNINNWNVSQVTDMSGMFGLAQDFNQPLNNWTVDNVTNMSSMFRNTVFNQNINNWIVDKVTDMSSMFSNARFNLPLDNWNVDNVENMANMFRSNQEFNRPLNGWIVSKVTNMSGMFAGSGAFPTSFNQPLDLWDVSSVTNMSYMFSVSDFNQPIDTWIVNNVENMQEMFGGWSTYYSSFNQPLPTWVTTNVRNMSGMFQSSVFNQDIGMWDVSNVTNMSNMFSRAQNFNQALNGWTVNEVTNMDNMFSNSLIFNQPLDNWNTGNVTRMNLMFSRAEAFDQNLGAWNITKVTGMTNMLSNSGLSQVNYDNTLIGWAAQEVENDINLGSLSLNYCNGRNARQGLIDNYNWIITGDIINCSFVLCTNLVSPKNGDINVPASANLVWQPTPNATGYRITVRIIRAGIESIPFTNFDVGNNTALNLETPLGADLLAPGDQVFVTIVPYNLTDGPAIGCTEESFTVVPSWVNSPAAFKLTYDTRLQRSSQTTPINQLKIETNSSLTYNYSIDWGDDQFDNNVTGNITHTYAIPGIYTVSIIGTFPAPRHEEFNSDSFKLLSIDQWGTQVWRSMDGAFAGCENMEYTISEVPNLSSVTNMSRMFIVCRKFNGNINNWEVSNVTNMLGTFGVATIYNQPLNNWNVSNVTNMSLMFFRTNDFNQNIDNWITSKVTTMSRMFEDARAFNQPVNGWDVSSVTNTADMFKRAPLFNQPLNSWTVPNVVIMNSMFEGATAFNQNINSWNVGNVTNMSSMFSQASSFNQPLNSWNVGKVTNMNSMFASASVFNQPLNSWVTTSVTNMANMFSSATAFNQNINSWNVTNVIDMQSMFNSATSFNQPLIDWEVNSVVNMSNMFRRASVFNQPILNWDVSAVANMTSMFESAVAFNQPLTTWDTSSVTIMRSMFESASVFNQNLNSWNVGVVTTMEEMFKSALVFNQPLASWNTGEVLNTKEMFSGASAFNQPINSWNVSFVTTMEEMFKDANAFNQPLNSWNVASVTTMRGMFEGATSFNGIIEPWNVRRVGTMENMFSGATNFNQTINNWRVNGVTNMNNMFRTATSFNQILDRWDIGNVTMQSMFDGATSFDQNLGDWDVSRVSDMRDMLDNTALTRENYDNTLIAWSEQTLRSGVILGAQGLVYCDAVEERQSMITNFGWTISDDVLDCPVPECTQLISPLNNAINVPVNTNLNWSPALFARGYRITVGVSVGGNEIADNITVTTTFYEFPTAFSGGETVYVTIIPFNDEGDAVGPCTTEIFTISSEPATVPDCTNLTAPLNNASDILVSTDLSWNPIANANGYKLNVGTTSGGTDILFAENVGNVITYEFTNNLPEDSDIFLTIIPYNDEGDAMGCIEESFKTELIPVPPLCTNLTTPLNNATDVPIDTPLSWTPVPNAIGYLVIVGTTSGGNEVVNNIDIVGATTYDIPIDLREDRQYYVTIIPYNDEGDAMGCTEETFRTANSNSPPSCTTLAIPINNATQVNPGTLLTWNAVTNVTGYRLIVRSDHVEIFNNDVGRVLSHNLTADLPQSTIIYVTVIPYNENGDAVGCSEESFTTDGPPLCTTLNNPTNNTTNVAVSLASISWNPSVNANGYKLTVIASNSTLNNLNDFNVTTGNSYNFTNNFEQGETVTVTILPYNATGDAVGCGSESFTIRPVPECTNLISPLNGATNIAPNTTLEWTPVANADGYKISVLASNSIANNVTDAIVSTGTSYTFLNDFEQGETVSVAITPYNDSGDSLGCSSESFTIKPIPTCTNLSAPINGAVVSNATSITWNAVDGANGYRVSITANNTTDNNISNFEVTSGNTYNFPNSFNQGEIVTVTIIPFNELGDAVGCTSESFTILPIPQCTTLTNPLIGATEVSILTDIEWNPSTYADGYRISVGTTPNGRDLVDNRDVASLTSFTFSEDLPSETLIYVTIIPYNDSGEAIGCTSENFETEIIIPDCTTLSSPFNGETDVPLEPNISWVEVNTASGYRLSIGTTPNGTDIVNNIENGVSTNYQITQELPFNTQIYVNIIPYNSKGDAIACEAQSFITLSPEDDTKYGFSPNGDGINEYWQIENIQYYPKNEVFIYNRWGDLVFKIADYNNNDNVFRGEANQMSRLGAGELPNGTYFFHIQIDGETILKKTKGYVVIKR